MLPGVQSPLCEPPSELAGAQQDLCSFELKDLLAFASCLPLGKCPCEQNQEQGVLVCAAGCSPGEAQQQLFPVCCTVAGLGSCFPFWSWKGLCTPWQMGGSDARVSQRFNPSGSCVGQGLPSLHCTLAVCLQKRCFARGLHSISLKGNGASLFTFHLPMSSCNCSLIPVELQPSGRVLLSAWQGRSCCSMASTFPSFASLGPQAPFSVLCFLQAGEEAWISFLKIFTLLTLTMTTYLQCVPKLCLTSLCGWGKALPERLSVGTLKRLRFLSIM